MSKIVNNPHYQSRTGQLGIEMPSQKPETILGASTPDYGSYVGPPKGPQPPAIVPPMPPVGELLKTQKAMFGKIDKTTFFNTLNLQKSYYETLKAIRELRMSHS